MRRRIIAVIALIPALLFGCAGPTTNTTTQTGNTSSQEVAQEDSTQNSVTLTALQRSDGWNYGGSGSDGFYYVSSSVRDDGSANLMYLDYATMEKFTCATSQIAIMIRKPAQVTCHTLQAGFCLA